MKFNEKLDGYFTKNSEKSITALVEDANQIKQISRNAIGSGAFAGLIYGLTEVGIRDSFLAGCGLYTCASLGVPAFEYVSAKAYLWSKKRKENQMAEQPEDVVVDDPVVGDEVYSPEVNEPESSGEGSEEGTPEEKKPKE